MSRLVNGFITAVGDPIMFREQENSRWVARLSWYVKSQLHYVEHVRWIKKQATQHHPFGWGVRVTGVHPILPLAIGA